MQFSVQVVAVDAAGAERIREVAVIGRDTRQLETLGLSLAEGKAILRSLQTLVVEQQVADHLERERRCPACGKARRRKGTHPLHFRTAFGTQTLTSPRLHHCPCQGHQQRTFSPLAARLPERTSPELTYLATKWASLASYGLTTKLLRDVLPLDEGVQPEMVRRQVQRVAARIDGEVACLRCGSQAVRKAGLDRKGAHAYRCWDCRRCFTARSTTPFADYRFLPAIIALAVRWYWRYRLSCNRQGDRGSDDLLVI